MTLEKIDLTAEPWKTLSSSCWWEPTPFRLGIQAEKHQIISNPYTHPLNIRLFDDGREAYRRYVSAQAATTP